MKPKDKVLLAYDLTQDNVELERIQAGLINSTWCIKCGYNIFILQKINHTILKIRNASRMIDDYIKRNHPRSEEEKDFSKIHIPEDYF